MNYTLNSVFNINDANRVIDMIYYQIGSYLKENSITDIDLNINIALSGNAAKKIQGGFVKDIEQIIVVTDVQKLFDIVLKVVHLVNNTGIIKLKDRVIITNSNFIIEFWLLEPETLNIVLVEKIIVQTLSEIPKIFL